MEIAINPKIPVKMHAIVNRDNNKINIFKIQHSNFDIQ